MNDKMSMSLK